MRSNRQRFVASYEEDSDNGSEERDPAAPEVPERASRHCLQDSGVEAGPSCAAAMAPRGGGDGQQPHSVALEEWEEEQLLALLSPESQKRERRRIANRDCARRIRQRKTELLAELGASMERLQADNARLLATLTEVTRAYRDTTFENCELRAQIALVQAGGSGGSRASGGTGGTTDSGEPSPVGLAAQLGSPGWLSPMAF